LIEISKMKKIKESKNYYDIDKIKSFYDIRKQENERKDLKEMRKRLGKYWIIFMASSKRGR
jgi:hypothetical protein